MKGAGYATGFIGRWHLGDEAFYPEYQGFDVNIGGISYGWPPGGYFAPDRNPKLPDGPKGEYLTDRLTDEAIAFLRRNKDRPFFLYLSHYAVHNPMQSNEDHAVYAGMVESVDESVGRIRKELDRLDLAESTCLIFMSDNGGLSTAEGSPTSTCRSAPARDGCTRAGSESR